MRYTDELDALRTARDALRLRIAERLALEAGAPVEGASLEAWLTAADEAIETWESEGEEAQDSRAFRPIGPLQDLLADHAALAERIAETLDRRLS
ncbi:hypothetical protein FHT98_4996 [Bosea sp. AK1]|uniref:hypothetical protein n=1 Tax=Bosea sp. AK1 TaxID=2587160 RepID=UPI0011547F01|nr:hypothetical protein [Bosea sp. AK1]TQI77188.1 hypothetical protein FHT98_4996 [Bosea sp. AK1]